MDVFEQFCKDVFPDETVEINISNNVDEFEVFYPDIVKIIKKDDTFFNVDRIVFGRNLRYVQESLREKIWKNILPCMLSSFFHGDIKKKVSKISGMIKNLWNASGQENDDVTRILNDEKSEGHFQEIIDYILNCRLAKIFTDLVESFDMTEFDLNIEDPAQLIEMIKDPENPTVKRITTKIQSLMNEKIQRGDFTQQTIVSEIEGIKAKVMSLFGNIFNDVLGGRKGEHSAATMMSNSPEARRQRMIARMQRKVREKNSK
jgi:hypothetical protein